MGHGKNRPADKNRGGFSERTCGDVLNEKPKSRTLHKRHSLRTRYRTLYEQNSL